MWQQKKKWSTERLVMTTDRNGTNRYSYRETNGATDR